MGQAKRIRGTYGESVVLCPGKGQTRLMLTEAQLGRFHEFGHVTVPGLFDRATMSEALADIDDWSREFIKRMSDEQARWYVEKGAGGVPTLRKLDDPVFHRPVFRRLARAGELVAIAEQLIGPGVSVCFSQVFCKPPEVGGPKPVHQDNFYFGPDNSDALLTAWIALDDATVKNGCLFYGDGTHRGPVRPHVAPPGEPFNLRIPGEALQGVVMTPAPVPAGGVSFHHGNTWHQSSANTSSCPRRAVAIHFLRNDASLVRPALSYDASHSVKITSAGRPGWVSSR